MSNGYQPKCNNESSPPNQESSIECDHKYIHESIHYESETFSYNTRYKKLDIYFCEKCLSKKEIIKEEYGREIPLWWRH